ncbi:MAG: hypothetical protein E8D47_11525 [Nitrospira sp.]|nr:MAG: hypothetical protein E8D47_11525 [Nitrospira sp.]
MATVNPAAPKQPLALPDRALVAATVEALLPLKGQFKTLAPLAGDASNRRYFRIELTGEAARSVIHLSTSIVSKAIPSSLPTSRVSWVM